MKAKTLGLMTLSILVLALVIGLTSAALILTPVSSDTFTYPGQQQVITLTAYDNFTVQTPIQFTVTGSATETPSDSGVFTGDFTFTLSPLITDSIYSEVVTVANSSDHTDNKTFTLNYVKSFCEYRSFVNDEDAIPSDLDELDLNVDISNEGQGDKEEWYALDTINVKVELENKFDEDDDMDMDDVILVLGVFNDDDADFSTNLAEDLIWISEDDEEFDLGNVDAEEDASHTFEFRVDPKELGEGNYILRVKAYNDEDTIKESSFCLDYSSDLEEEYYTTFSVEAADDDQAVIVDVDSLDLPIEVSCGGTHLIEAEVWNVGDDDALGNDYVLINFYNEELEVDLWGVIEGDVDVGDSKTVIFEVEIPTGIEEKDYTFHFRTYYDYDEDEDEEDTSSYDESSEDTFDVSLRVSGNCALSQALVSASLDEGGKAGRELVVRSTITNTGTKSTTYLVNAVGYSEWASLINVDPSTTTLEAGQSADVLITLKVNRDVSGERLFNIEVLSEGELVVSQPLSVSVEKALIGDIFGDNGLLTTLIIGIALILVIIIIVLAIRVARR